MPPPPNTPVAPPPPPAAGLWLLPGSPLLRRSALALIDAALMAGGLALNFEIWLRFRHGTVPADYVSLFAHVVVPIVGARLLALHAFGLYRAIGRHAGVYELTRIAVAQTIVAAALCAANFALALAPPFGSFPSDSTGRGLLRVPWGVMLNDWTFSILLIGGVRIARREVARRIFAAPGGRRVLVVGANETGAGVAEELARTTDGAYVPVGYVDPDPALKGSRIGGLPVAGTLEDLAEVVERLGATDLVVALRRPTPKVLGEIVAQCRRARLGFKLAPSLDSVMTGRVSVSALRPVEIEDLLGRDPVRLDEGDPWMRGKTVLVTGAGGSIGRELCRQSIAQSPRRIVLLGRGENSLFEALLELSPFAREKNVELVPRIGDVRDREVVRRIFAETRPEVVFHAAAHKHVHFMEAQPCEAAKNNVLGTLVAAETAAEFGAERFVLVSTDKAVRPTGTMGASKRAAEAIVAAAGAEARGVFVSVRFGNVLGSRGSVVPTFRRQIERGGPVTVTHPDVTRYFMTIPEAVSLVIRAGATGRGGEVFVLDMGRPVRIVDLARNLITLSGLEPDEDVPIVFTGLRPGEKLTEELLTDEEGTTATEHGKIFVARSVAEPKATLMPKVAATIAAAEAGDDAGVLAGLRSIVPDFRATPARPEGGK